MMVWMVCALILDGGWAVEGTEIFQPLQRHEVIVTETGRVFIVNFPESRVQVYDSDGEQERIIGRKGKGPGEFTFPAQFFHQDGRLYVYDWLESTVSVFDAEDGSYIDRNQTPTNNVRLAKVKGGWVYGTWGMIAMGDPAEVYWANVDFSEAKKLIDLPSGGLSQGNWNWDTGGRPRAFYSKLSTHPLLITAPDRTRVYMTDIDRFELTIIDGVKGEVAGEISRDEPRVPFDEAWGIDGADEVRRRRKAANPNVKLIVNAPEYFPAIRGAAFDPDGNLVIDRWRGRPDEKHHPITLDITGTEQPQKWPFVVLERIVGVVDGQAYITCFEEETEEASIVAVPLSKAIAYVTSHPLFTKEHSVEINVD